MFGFLHPKKKQTITQEGGALITYLADHARYRRDGKPMYSTWIPTAERISPELAERIRVFNRAQRELDDYILFLAEGK